MPYVDISQAKDWHSSSANTCLPLNMLHEVALALAGLGLSTVGMTPSPSTLAPSPSESIHPRTVVRTC